MDSERRGPDAVGERVMDAVVAFDGVSVRRVLYRYLHSRGVDSTVVDIIAPVLQHIGLGWQSGSLGVVHEHFASSVFRGVLGELRTPLSAGRDRTVVLACPPDELHDLPLELFGAMLHQRGWRTVSLGANTPLTSVAEAVRALEADACVLAGVRPEAFALQWPALADLGSCVPLFLAGEGALGLVDAPPGTGVLSADLIAAADRIDQVPVAADRDRLARQAGSGIR